MLRTWARVRRGPVPSQSPILQFSQSGGMCAWSSAGRAVDATDCDCEQWHNNPTLAAKPPTPPPPPPLFTNTPFPPPKGRGSTKAVHTNHIAVRHSPPPPPHSIGTEFLCPQASVSTCPKERHAAHTTCPVGAHHVVRLSIEMAPCGGGPRVSHRMHPLVPNERPKRMGGGQWRNSCEPLGSPITLLMNKVIARSQCTALRKWAKKHVRTCTSRTHW